MKPSDYGKPILKLKTRAERRKALAEVPEDIRPFVELYLLIMKPRTEQQNKALHVYLRELSEALNDAGYDIKTVLEHAVDRPWTETAAKELLWRPIQKAMTRKHSTTEPSTIEVQDIYEVLNKHTAEKLGIHVPWPEKDHV